MCWKTMRTHPPPQAPWAGGRASRGVPGEVPGAWAGPVTGWTGMAGGREQCARRGYCGP